MRQSIPTHPTDGCERCTESTVCTAHRQYATPARPTAASLLAGAGRTAPVVNVFGGSYLVEGHGNPGNRPSHD